MDAGEVTWAAGVLVTAEQEPGVPAGYAPHCRVFWGSHGCQYPRGHPPEVPHSCDCCECEDHPDPDPVNPGCKPSCVAKPPYYGKQTRFYGEDAEAPGLPIVS
jgi:hypothetical protein